MDTPGQVVIANTPPAVDQAAHDAAMIAKVDGTPKVPESAPAGDRPSWLPEKFATAEDFAKSYAELEAKQGAAKPDTPAPEATPPEGDPKSPEGEAAKELAGKGLDLAEFSKEFSEKGTLTPESYAKLEASGYPKAVVDQYIAGQTALAVQYEADIKSASGEHNFDEVAAWAATGLTGPEIDAYNKAIDTKDPAQAKLAVAGITAKYAASNPTEGNLLAGRTGAVTAVGYESMAQMKADMANPQYKLDPAFRKSVADKIANSSIM